VFKGQLKSLKYFSGEEILIGLRLLVGSAEFATKVKELIFKGHEMMKKRKITYYLIIMSAYVLKTFIIFFQKPSMTFS
jgi:hypothetical protein